MAIWGKTCNGVVGNDGGDVIGSVRPIRPEPVGRPIERAEKSACGDDRIRRRERAAAEASGYERADAAFVAVPFGHDDRAEPAGEGVDLEVGGRPFDFVQEAQDVRLCELTKPGDERTFGAARLGERVQQVIERAVLTEKQQLVLAAKVVVEVARRQVGFDGDLAHAGGGEAPGAKDAGGRSQNADAPGIGTP
jgi:hypothetical protein